MNKRLRNQLIVSGIGALILLLTAALLPRPLQSQRQAERWAGESGQRWKFKKNSDGSVTLTNALGTALHLNGNKTANGTNVIAKTAAATTAQRWYLQ